MSCKPLSNLIALVWRQVDKTTTRSNDDGPSGRQFWVWTEDAYSRPISSTPQVAIAPARVVVPLAATKGVLCNQRRMLR